MKKTTDEPTVETTTRMPASVHERLKKAADQRPINKLVLRFIDEGLERMEKKSK